MIDKVFEIMWGENCGDLSFLEGQTSTNFNYKSLQEIIDSEKNEEGHGHLFRMRK
jgi:hypothetical protein